MLTASLSSLSTRNLLNRTTKGCHYEWHPFIVHTNITTRCINDTRLQRNNRLDAVN